MNERAAHVTSFLGRVGRRSFIAAALRGIALSAILTAVAVAFAGMSDIRAVWMTAIVSVGVGVASIRRRPAILTLVEARIPSSRNLITTASELARLQVHATPHAADAVFDAAARIVSAVRPADVIPMRRVVVFAGAAALLWGAAFAGRHSLRDAIERRSGIAGGNVSVDAVEVIITPPAYTGQAPRTVRDPARIEAMAGSALRFVIAAHAERVVLETAAGARTLQRAPERFEGTLVADADAFIAIRAFAPDSAAASSRRLIALSVIPDRAPVVRITAPAKDLFLPDAGRSIDITIDATDDHALASLVLRYTKVTGSGEKFTFVDGEVALRTTQADTTHWTAAASLALAPLKLEPGDMVVYRALASDKRPGIAPAESDSYIIEITSPGAVASEGFAVDDERDRYAVSQQMVILKTERLIARQARMHMDSVRTEAVSLAAEQRAVRAEFVFMMGGEVAEEVLAAAGMGDLDETAEAAAEEDLAAGRLANQGRIALVRAIRSMSRANTALNEADLTRALREEKDALVYLQSAFARARYILRALTQREQLDPARRLTGILTGAGRDIRVRRDVQRDTVAVVLARALSDLAGFAATPDSTRRSDRMLAIAQQIIAADPASAPLQRVASSLTSVASSLDDAGTAQLQQLLDSAAVLVTRTARSRLPVTPPDAEPVTLRQLRGALREARR
jgi:hypothetical protein